MSIQLYDLWDPFLPLHIPRSQGESNQLAMRDRMRMDIKEVSGRRGGVEVAPG